MKERVVTASILILLLGICLSRGILFPPVLLIFILLSWEIFAREPFNRWSFIAWFQAWGIMAAADMNPKEIGFLAIVVIVNDSAAYFGGRYFNTPMWQVPIFPKTSPKKTWGGFFYGVLFAQFAAVLFNAIYPVIKDAAFAGISIALLGVAGDWLESKFKRSHSIKDSGEGLFTAKLLKGHGGVYDRFDAASLAIWGWVLFFKT